MPRSSTRRKHEKASRKGSQNHRRLGHSGSPTQDGRVFLDNIMELGAIRAMLDSSDPLEVPRDQLQQEMAFSIAQALKASVSHMDSEDGWMERQRVRLVSQSNQQGALGGAQFFDGMWSQGESFAQESDLLAMACETRCLHFSLLVSLKTVEQVVPVGLRELSRIEELISLAVSGLPYQASVAPYVHEVELSCAAVPYRVVNESQFYTNMALNNRTKETELVHAQLGLGNEALLLDRQKSAQGLGASGKLQEIERPFVLIGTVRISDDTSRVQALERLNAALQRLNSLTGHRSTLSSPAVSMIKDAEWSTLCDEKGWFDCGFGTGSSLDATGSFEPAQIRLREAAFFAEGFWAWLHKDALAQTQDFVSKTLDHWNANALMNPDWKLIIQGFCNPKVMTLDALTGKCAYRDAQTTIGMKVELTMTCQGESHRLLVGPLAQMAQFLMRLASVMEQCLPVQTHNIEIRPLRMASDALFD